MPYLYHVNHYSYVNLRPVFTVGRTTGDLVISGSSLSGRHAQFLLEDVAGAQTLFVVDLHSKNRTVVNRFEIVPGEKIRLDVNSLVEMGGQSFIVTNRNDLSINDVNELIEQYSKRLVTRLESGHLIQDVKDKISSEVNKLEDDKTNIHNKLVRNESLLKKLELELSEVAQTTEGELQKLEQLKNRLLADSEERKKKLTTEISQLKIEIDEEKAEIQRIRKEVELKKKKIIDLKQVAGD